MILSVVFSSVKEHTERSWYLLLHCTLNITTDLDVKQIRYITIRGWGPFVSSIGNCSGNSSHFSKLIINRTSEQTSTANLHLTYLFRIVPSPIRTTLMRSFMLRLKLCIRAATRRAAQKRTQNLKKKIFLLCNILDEYHNKKSQVWF